MRHARTRGGWGALLGAASAVCFALAPVCAPVAAQPDNEFVHYRRLEIGTPWGPQRVLVTYPRRSDRRQHPPGERYPILVALHGRSEALQGPERGFLGWATRYGLPEAMAALGRGRLERGDYRYLVRPTHLAYVNQHLRAQAFRGMLVVTPFVPDIGGEELGAWEVTEYADWLAGPLVDAIRERFPTTAALTREGVGIDGVSLGGRVSLEAGFRHPEVFAAVGASQPAIRDHEEALAALGAAAGATHPQRIRLLTSDADPYVWATRRLSTGLRERQVAHGFAVFPGPHDYVFNRGPGALEMLLFHERALAREPAPEE